MILTPEIVFRKIECIHPDYLKAHGITALVLDVDNTLTGDNSQVLEPTVQAWLDEMRAAGISLTIVSNNTAKRVRPFAERIGLDWVPLACKPLTIGLMVARHRLGVKKSQMAMVGDQIFADRMAAGLYGCPCFGSLHPPLAALTFAASSIICAFGLASAAPRSPYRHLELCGIALTNNSIVFAS